MSHTIADLATEVRDTYTPNNENTLPYIGLEHVEQGTLHLSAIGSSQEVKSQKFRFKSGDILFGTLRPYFRKVVVAPCDGVCSTEFCVVRPNSTDDRYFLFYCMAQSAFIKYATVNSKGARPRTKWEFFSDFTLPQFMPLQYRSIGAMLWQYDDLIDNNRRRIQLLEQAARLLYKEWFVHLRFPGHEHVKIKDGVPEGWEKKLLGEVAPLKYGKALKQDNRIPGPFPVYGSSGIVGTHQKALVDGPAIILGRKGNVGSVYWSKDDFHPIDTVYFIEKENYSVHLYYALLYTSFISTDVAVPGLNRDFAYSRKLLIPEPKILRLFEEVASSIHEYIDLLQKYNIVLASARDTLLSRLMNGELTV